MITEIYDAHCHIYPDKIAHKAVEAVTDFYPAIPDEQLDGTCETLIRTGKANGITHFIVHSVATTPHQVHSINAFIAQSVQNSDGAFTGLGTMHPDLESIPKAMEELILLGLHGVKLHPDIQKFPADDPRIMPVYEICESMGLPVLVHTGDHRYDFSNPPRIANILKTFPRLSFIGAHFGGWSVWDEAAKVLTDFDNIAVDFSSSTHWLGTEKTRDLIRIWGEDRVMFGTDYPLWPQKPEIDRLLQMDLTDDGYRKIFNENCKRIYHTEEA